MKSVSSLMSDLSSKPSPSFFRRIVLLARLVKFSHSIFALPFALSMFILVAEHYPIRATQLLFIIVCLVSARTAAMGFNRLVDREIDSKNPRTDNRELPTEKVSVREAQVLVLASSFIFLVTTGLLGWHCLVLAPFVLTWLLLYSYMKRLTWFTHLWLGSSLALAPGGVWYAVTAEFSWMPVSMMLGVAFWVAGFDILYSCQDYEFDREHNLKSLPARFGPRKSFAFAKSLHVMSVFCLVFVGILFPQGLCYFVGMLVFTFYLLRQYYLVNPEDLSNIDRAFFSQNAWASVVYFCGVFLDYLF